MVTKGIPEGDCIQEFGPLGLVRRGEGSAFEMELLTSFPENITCSEKKFGLLEDIFRGDIWGNVWQLGVGESRGDGKCETMAMTGEGDIDTATGFHKGGVRFWRFQQIIISLFIFKMHFSIEGIHHFYYLCC